MKAIKSTGYSIYFNKEGYQSLNSYITEYQPSKIVVLVDENTNKYCLKRFKSNIDSSIVFEAIVIKASEVFKNINTCVDVWSKLTDYEVDRKSLLINLGGGMVTDLGGFVASTYKRGVKFINVPTTLLSMVDASVGSKTGVDLDNLKNLVGLFSNPEMVLIDIEYLDTLEPREMNSGLAEIIKYGLTFDNELLVDVKNNKWKNINDLKEIIHRSIIIKNNVVLKDIKENNLRKVLNFGHTVGHAIESFFLNEKQLADLLHGEAIAIGMIIEAFISFRQYNFPKSELDSLKEYIHNIYGKVDIPKSSFKEIIDLMRHDKKNTKGKVNYILLENIGEFLIDCGADLNTVIEGIEYYKS